VTSFTDDPLTLVAGGEERAAFAFRRALGMRLEQDGSQTTIGVAEVRLEPLAAVLRPASVEVGRDALTASRGLQGFVTHGSLYLLCQGLGRFRGASPVFRECES
jgi:hypothetical protein